MADESNPWEGVALVPEKPRAAQPPVERRSPLDERTLNQAEVLAGLRGDKSEHAVRFKDLEKIKREISKDAASFVINGSGSGPLGSIGEQLAAQFAAIDTESKSLLADYNKLFDQALQGIDTLGQEVEGTFDTFETTLNGNTTAISSMTVSIDGVKAQYGIRVNNNGHISGFGLLSQLINGQPTSDFIINDASFRIVNSSGVGDFTPFAVYPTERTVDGVTVPPGVYAQDLYVTNANIASLKADKIDTRNLTVKDASGNILLGAGTPLNWSNVGGSGKPEDNANRTTNTNQLTDGAGLGTSAHWAYVYGAGKPADNADVTGDNDAGGVNGGSTYVNSGSAPRAVRIAGSYNNVYGLYVVHNTYTNGAMYAQSPGGFTGQFINTNSGGGLGQGTYCAIDAQNTNNGCQAKLGAGHGVHILSGGLYNASGTYPFTAGHDGMVAKGTVWEPGDIVVEGQFIATKLSNSFAELILSSTASQKNAVGVLTEVKDWIIPGAFIDEEASRQARMSHIPTIEKPAADDVLTHHIEDYSGTYDYALTNSVGEGAINVCGENGNIYAGDLIVTSSIPGKGMKQADDIVRSITVARARQDVTFASPTEVKQVACIYMCG